MNRPMDAADLAQVMLENSALMTWPGLCDLRLAGVVAAGRPGLNVWRRACELAQAAQVSGRLAILAAAREAQATQGAALKELLELVEAQAVQLQDSHHREAELRQDVIRLEGENHDAEVLLQAQRVSMMDLGDRAQRLEAELQAAQAQIFQLEREVKRMNKINPEARAAYEQGAAAATKWAESWLRKAHEMECEKPGDVPDLESAADCISLGWHVPSYVIRNVGR
jgi:hypothetical protein